MTVTPAPALCAILMLGACGAEEPVQQASAGDEVVAPPQPAPASAAQGDADDICRAATEASSVQDPMQRALAFAERLSELTLTADTARGFQALDGVAPGERYAALQRVFADQGVADWQCPALATWWTE